MADQKRWFKVWTSILSDSRFDPFESEQLTNLGRFAWLGAYAALHGDSGKFHVPKSYLLSKLQIANIGALSDISALHNVTFEEGKSVNGEIIVTIKNWFKYQVDSTAAERVKRSRYKRRGEERREEERRRDIHDPTDLNPIDVTAFVEDWNSEFDGKLPSVRLPLTSSRLRKLKLRLEEHPEEEFWNTVFTNIYHSKFLLGNGSTGWKCTFDFLIANDSNCIKIAEGNYAESKEG